MSLSRRNEFTINEFKINSLQWCFTGWVGNVNPVWCQLTCTSREVTIVTLFRHPQNSGVSTTASYILDAGKLIETTQIDWDNRITFLCVACLNEFWWKRPNVPASYKVQTVLAKFWKLKIPSKYDHRTNFAKHTSLKYLFSIKIYHKTLYPIQTRFSSHKAWALKKPKTFFGLYQQSYALDFVLIISGSSNGSGESAQMLSLARSFTARIHKVWLHMKTQTKKYLSACHKYQNLMYSWQLWYHTSVHTDVLFIFCHFYIEE